MNFREMIASHLADKDVTVHAGNTFHVAIVHLPQWLGRDQEHRRFVLHQGFLLP